MEGLCTAISKAVAWMAVVGSAQLSTLEALQVPTGPSASMSPGASQTRRS